MPQLTAAQQDQLKALGIDWTKLDLAKIVGLIQMLLSLFDKPVAERKAAFKAAGCHDEDSDCCDVCCQAAHKALEAAALSLSCCHGYCGGPKPAAK